MREDELKMNENTNKMRDRLINLLKQAEKQQSLNAVCGDIYSLIDSPKGAEFIADYLLANGVVVLTFSGGDKEKSHLSGWIPCDLVDHPEHCRACEVTRKDTIGYVRDIAFYTDKWRREADEIPVDVIAWKEPSKPYMARREEAERALKGGE